MTYVDVTLTPEATYTYVNARQVYDAVAGAMTTHPAWDFVEYKDAINGANTHRRYVWRCNAAQSGLSADFFVVFEAPFVTATSVWSTTAPVKVYLGETYSAGVLGKFATAIAASVTLASDLTNPATFTLTTYAVPASIWNVTNAFGTSTVQTSLRFLCLIAKDSVVLTKAVNGGGTTTATTSTLVVGAYDSVMSPAADPLPLVIFGATSSTGGGAVSGGATRAPTMTAGVAYTEVFSVTNQSGAGQDIGNLGHWDATELLQGFGMLGNPADTTWFKNIGGPLVTRLVVFPFATTASNMSTKGVLRGHLKNVYGANQAAHSYGDTFVVNGKVFVGIGGIAGSNGALIDTEAA